jgi:hypothetical protein
LVQPDQELLQKWGARAASLYPRMEITGEGLTLGAGTVLVGKAQDKRGAQGLTLDDEPRIVTAFEQQVDTHVLAKIGRPCELWDEGEKALAHIHLAHAGLPPCEEERALRLFVVDELLEAGVTPVELMKAQGFDPAPLALLKFNPDQPRVPRGNGRESGRWTSESAVTPASHRPRGRIKALSTLLEWLRSRLGTTHESPPEKAPPHEGTQPAPKTPEPSQTEQPPKADPNKLHHIFDNPEHPFGDFISQYGSQGAALRAIEDATPKLCRSSTLAANSGLRSRSVGGV